MSICKLSSQNSDLAPLSIPDQLQSFLRLIQGTHRWRDINFKEEILLDKDWQLSNVVARQKDGRIVLSLLSDYHYSEKSIPTTYFRSSLCTHDFL